MARISIGRISIGRAILSLDTWPGRTNGWNHWNDSKVKYWKPKGRKGLGGTQDVAITYMGFQIFSPKPPGNLKSTSSLTYM